jgi:hypothetical protein
MVCDWNAGTTCATSPTPPGSRSCSRAFTSPPTRWASSVPPQRPSGTSNTNFNRAKCDGMKRRRPTDVAVLCVPASICEHRQTMHCDSRLLLVCVCRISFAGVAFYRSFMMHCNWRTVYVLTSICGTVFSIMQVCGLFHNLNYLIIRLGRHSSLRLHVLASFSLVLL